MSLKQPTAKDQETIERVLVEAREAIANGKIGVGALLRCRDEIITISHNLYQEIGELTAG